MSCFLPQLGQALDQPLQACIKREADQTHDQDYGRETVVFERVPRIVDGVAEARFYAQIFSGHENDPTHAQREPNTRQDILCNGGQDHRCEQMNPNPAVDGAIFARESCILRHMSHDTPHFPVHPAGEQPPIEQETALAPATLDTWAGPVRVEWDPTAPLTPYGQLPFFIEYLKVADLFGALVADCPLTYTSPNAPEKRDVLGTTMLSVLAGHKRYAHITALRNDGVLPELLGMKKIVSEDAVRRGFKAIGEGEGREWLQRHLDYCTAPLLFEPWVLDADSTVKPLYGHQEGAVLGYNPKKPGRPSHAYHTYTMAGLRLVLDVEVAAGNEHASKHAAPGLWALLDRIPRDCWPAFLRGDSGFGTEAVMREAERRGFPICSSCALPLTLRI